MRAASLHVMGDLLGSVAALVAAIVIILTGWVPIDPILSVLVALVILRSAWQVVRDSGHILLESAPEGVDTREIARDLTETFPEVVDVHHVHVWSITQERTMITLHARIASGSNNERITADIKRWLKEQFRIAHATVEIESEVCADHGGAVGTEKTHQHEHC
jgi:cobalt-zinc-cadmium efflux system protein